MPTLVGNYEFGTAPGIAAIAPRYDPSSSASAVPGRRVAPGWIRGFAAAALTLENHMKSGLVARSAPLPFVYYGGASDIAYAGPAILGYERCNE